LIRRAVIQKHKIVNQLKQRPCPVSRRECLLLLAGLACWSSRTLAEYQQQDSVIWDSFVVQIKKLADAAASGKTDSKALAEQGMRLLRELRLDTAEFEAAVNEAYESGNQFWMWQRLLKEKHINGGILSIERERLVPLHDHPGASGMVRIIRGAAEIWQYDVVASSAGHDGNKIAELKRVSRRILRPGDTAVLTPDTGNIHAIRAVSEQCSMLDFFIPPYQRSRRSWYEPADNDWFNRKSISCRSIPQHEYTMALTSN